METSRLPRLSSVWQQKSQRGTPLSSFHLSPLHLPKSLPRCLNTCPAASVLAYLYSSFLSVFRITALSAARQKGGPQVVQASCQEGDTHLRETPPIRREALT